MTKKILCYTKKDNQYVIAVQLKLDTNGFVYQKWGAEQQCKKGDWIVNNNGEIYTVDKDVFASTYRETDEGRFVKTSQVWAEQVTEPGKIKTKEGESSYVAGDFLVYNDSNKKDGYCIEADKFKEMYELD